MWKTYHELNERYALTRSPEVGDYIKEIRDPVHVFIRIDETERAIIDSHPFQRLRNIHQLAMTYLVYPGATHRRFEHSLGVMELAGRIYDIITNPDNIIDDTIHSFVPRRGADWHHGYWRSVLRIAALCHDLGHLPFSHGAEDLMPPGWNHERLTLEIIFNSEITSILKEAGIQPEHVAKLAVGPQKYRNEPFTVWEAILAEIIVGNAFGADRIDYLLRDSHHCGVAYGRFDYHRLLEKLRILPAHYEGTDEPSLGIEYGGMQVAEALLLARYFMFTQVYYHRVRRIYDLHLKEFLRAWLPEGSFPTDLATHLYLTDNEVQSAIAEAYRCKIKEQYEPARCILRRDHFRLVYEHNPKDHEIYPQPGYLLFQGLCEKFDASLFRHDVDKKENAAPVFPVLLRDGTIESSINQSELLKRIPPLIVDNIFVHPNYVKEVETWLRREKDNIIGGTT
jgi:HD superfamily phosphohydrolase